jgi:PBP1b-binding outer membrane lipoprotein LpoB
MSLISTKTASIFGSLAIATLLLSGCSASQSKADACSNLQDGMDSLETEMTQSMTDFQSDPTAAGEAISGFSETFSENVETVTNDEVKPVAEDADAALASFAEEFATFVEDPTSADTSGLETSSTELQTTFASLSELCS